MEIHLENAPTRALCVSTMSILPTIFEAQNVCLEVAHDCNFSPTKITFEAQEYLVCFARFTKSVKRLTLRLCMTLIILN